MSSRPRGGLPTLLTAACLAACVAGPPEDVPLPDLSGAEADVVEAVRRDRDAVLATPGSAAAWGRLGDRMLAHDWYEEAEVCYLRAEGLAEEPFLWSYRAAQSTRVVDPEKAADHFARALARNDGYGPGHLAYAEVLIRLGRATDAARAYARANELLPGSSHAALGLGQIALAEQRFRDAREHLEEALRRDPDHGEVHVALSQTWLALGDDVRAAEHAERSRRLPKSTPWTDPLASPEVPPAGARARTDAAALLEQRGQVREALEQYRAALGSNPGYLPAHISLGLLLMRQGALEEAAGHFEEALRLQESSASAHESLGFVLSRLGRVDGALEHLHRALEIDPDRFEARFNLAGILAGTGRLEEAASQLESAVSLRPGDADTRAALARVLMGLDREGEAAGHLDEALRVAPSHGPSLMMLGDLRLRQGRYPEALQRYRSALAVRPMPPQAPQRAAWLLATSPVPSVRDASEAIRLAEEAVRATAGRSFVAADTLAAALAEAGRYDEAAARAREAIAMAEAAGAGERAASMRERLALYERGRPFRDRP